MPQCTVVVSCAMWCNESRVKSEYRSRRPGWRRVPPAAKSSDAHVRGADSISPLATMTMLFTTTWDVLVLKSYHDEDEIFSNLTRSSKAETTAILRSAKAIRAKKPREYRSLGDEEVAALLHIFRAEKISFPCCIQHAADFPVNPAARESAVLVGE